MDWLFIHFGAACKGGNFLFFPPWYEYLPGKPDANHLCTPQLGSLNDVWLIVAAIIEILLRVAALVAVGFIIYGGVEYMTSMSEPDKTTKARETIIYALVGLAIALLSAGIINFIATRVS